MLPQQLYQFVSPKDSTGARLEVVLTRNILGQASATSVSTPILRVPGDRVLLLTNINASGQAGGVQNALTARAFVVDEAGNQFGNFFSVSQASGSSIGADRQVQIWVPPLFGVQCIATFDAGAVANFAILAVYGILFPRANVQIGALQAE